MAARAKKFHQAALTYLVYGLLYWGGGFYLIAQNLSQQSGVLWFIIGGLFILVFPPLIWHGASRKGLMWFTRILAVFVFIRVLGLGRVILNDPGNLVPTPWGSELPMRYGAITFVVIAAITCGMLARAGWNIGETQADTAEP